MFIERLITFIILGFFVYVADVGSWWDTTSLADWYANYIVWLGLILVCFFAARRETSGDDR